MVYKRTDICRLVDALVSDGCRLTMADYGDGLQMQEPPFYPRIDSTKSFRIYGRTPEDQRMNMHLWFWQQKDTADSPCSHELEINIPEPYYDRACSVLTEIFPQARLPLQQ